MKEVFSQFESKKSYFANRHCQELVFQNSERGSIKALV